MTKNQSKPAATSFVATLQKAAVNIGQALPIIVGVLLLFGLYRNFIPNTFLRQIFTGNIFKDTFMGSVAGSILAGNAVNSYIIGGELLKDGVSLYAVTAFLVTWVTIGVVQFPAEVAFLGKSFAIKRNFLSFVLSFLVAIATVITLKILG
ncbi:MAG: hypothetical protein J7L94_12645 [Caldisericaceae bacterium]|nr:hypothetical protein [Caldisericaceae bacterium]